MAVAQGWQYPTPLPGARPDMPWGDIYAPARKRPWTPPPKDRPAVPAYPWGGGGGYAPAQQGWFGGGGGGPAGPTAWQGDIGWGGVPWATWQETPWAQAPKGRSEEAMQWFNTMLPWMQQQAQGQQWGKSFDWRKAMDEWNQAFQEGQFGWQKESDVWARGFQEQQLGQQKQLEQEAQSMAAFGRRWKPSTRWM